jgi:hypothetical protein
MSIINNASCGRFSRPGMKPALHACLPGRLATFSKYEVRGQKDEGKDEVGGRNRIKNTGNDKMTPVAAKAALAGAPAFICNP